jgi:hypothetical protein
MSWLFSQVLVAEYLGESSLDGEPSVPLNGNNTQLAYLPPDKMTDYLKVSQFGMMFKPLMESRGEELLMSYLADFRAKTSAKLEKELELAENGQECGRRWQGLLAKYDQDTHSLRTVQCSLLEDLNECLQIWPAWGSMRNGECWEQTMLEHPTSEKEFGLSEKIPNNLNFFHTPNTTGIDGGSNSRKALKKRLAETPSGNWPTPTCSDIYTGNLKSTQQKEGSMHSVTLPQAVRGAEQINNGQLNPMWVEWLMGWPIGWTDLKPLETDKCHYVQQPLGTS